MGSNFGPSKNGMDVTQNHVTLLSYGVLVTIVITVLVYIRTTQDRLGLTRVVVKKTGLPNKIDSSVLKTAKILGFHIPGLSLFGFDCMCY